MNRMTDSELEKMVDRVATTAAEKALHQMFLVMGINVEDKDDLIRVQRDFAHLRKWRTNVEALTMKGLLVAAGTVATFIIGAVWVAIQNGIGKH